LRSTSRRRETSSMPLPRISGLETVPFTSASIAIAPAIDSIAGIWAARKPSELCSIFAEAVSASSATLRSPQAQAPGWKGRAAVITRGLMSGCSYFPERERSAAAPFSASSRRPAEMDSFSLGTRMRSKSNSRFIPGAVGVPVAARSRERSPWTWLSFRKSRESVCTGRLFTCIERSSGLS